MYKEEEELTYEDFKTFMTQWITEQNSKPQAEWTKTDKDYNEAIKRGIFNGNSSQGIAYRDQVAVMINRALGSR